MLEMLFQLNSEYHPVRSAACLHPLACIHHCEEHASDELTALRCCLLPYYSTLALLCCRVHLPSRCEKAAATVLKLKGEQQQ
jgi:hypothetical protein